MYLKKKLKILIKTNYFLFLEKLKINFYNIWLNL